MRLAAVLVALTLTAGSVRAQPAPTLAIEAPPELAAERARLDAYDLRPLSAIVRLTGLEAPGPPMRVVLADTRGELARQVPSFVAGFAVGEDGLIVLFPARSPGYPHDTLEDVLRHEVAHVLISRAAGGHAVPRWFHEGVAVAVERPWDLEDRTRLASTLVFGPRLDLAVIDALFGGGEAAQARAYSLSAAMVRHLMAVFGEDAPARVLREVSRGRPFASALAAITARPLPQLEDEFWNAQRTWTTWVPLLASSTVLWLTVIGLAVAARHRRSRRSVELRQRWAADEAAVGVEHAAPGEASAAGPSGDAPSGAGGRSGAPGGSRAEGS
jgi:hypothetical protein